MKGLDAMQKARSEIDRIDAEMAALFEARMAAAAEIAARKRETGLPVRDPAREAELLARNTARIEDPALRTRYAAFLQHTMALSRDYQTALLCPDGPERLTVHAAGGSYPLLLRRGLLGGLDAVLPQDRRLFLVTDDGVPARYGEAVASACRCAGRFVLPQGEAHKTPEALTALLSAMLEAELTRSDCVVAVGGGVAGDLGGLAAALYMRGIGWYDVPTTLLAMADASVGGKTAVDLDGVKNAAGAFWPPKAVLIDPDTLDSLPRRQLANGLAEALKMALTHDAALFARFEDPQGYGPVEELIAACLRIKRAVVEADEREAGPRRTLNFGHTLGHGIEAAAGGALLHGECVALGMLAMSGPALRARLRPVLERLGLPTYVNFDQIDPEAVLAAVTHDKKALPDGSLEVVTVPEPGRCTLRSAGPAELRERLRSLAAPQQG